MEVDGLVSGLETGPTERIEITYSVRFRTVTTKLSIRNEAITSL
jgi:hypothetical protein